MTKEEIECRIGELECYEEHSLLSDEREELAALQTMLAHGLYEPIGAKMPGGSIVCPWDERLRTVGGVPVYE